MNVGVRDDLLERVDRLVERGNLGFSSRSEAVHQAIREFLAKWEPLAVGPTLGGPGDAQNAQGAKRKHFRGEGEADAGATLGGRGAGRRGRGGEGGASL